MAAGDRESTFILRAADLSSQPIKDVIAQLDRLIATQQKVNEQTAAGTISNSDAKKAIDDLKTALKALVDQKATLTEFARAQEAYEGRLLSVAAAEKRLADFRASLPSEDERTTKQVNALARLEKSLLSAQGRADSAQRYFEIMSDTLAKMGVSADGVGAAEEQLSAAISKVTPELQRAAAVNLTLLENRQRAIAVAKAQEEVERQVTASYKADQAEKLRLYEEEGAASARLAQRKAKDAADEIEFRRKQRQSDLEFVFKPVIDQQDAETELAKRRDKANRDALASSRLLEASQQKIDKATEVIPATQPLGQAVAPLPEFSSVSEGLSGILDPASRVRETLIGLQKEVTSASAVLEGARKKDDEYSASLRRLGAAFVDLRKVAKLADTYKENEAAASRAEAEFNKERNTLEAMTALYARMKVADTDLEQRITRQAVVVKQAGSSFNELNTQFVQSRAAMETAGIGVKTFEEDVGRLNTTAETARVSFDKINAASGKGSDGFRILGLRPYEFKNLTYQINDVFTQLASGTSFTQTAAQQSGQIFQLYEDKIGRFILKVKEIPGAMTGIGVAVGAVTVGVLAFIRAIDVASERRTFGALLKQDVDGARYSVENLVATSKDLERFGVSLTDAANAARSLAAAGASPDRIRPLLQLAAAFANANNLKFPEAVKQVLTAFTGTGSELIKWTTQLNNLLTFDQAERIRKLVENGDIVSARTEAFNAVFGKMKEAADVNTSAIVKSFRDLKTAFYDFLDALASNRVVNWFGTEIVKTLREGIGLATDLLRLLDAVSKLNLSNAWRAIRGLPPEKEEGQPLPTVPAIQAPSMPGQKPGETPEFVTLRDQVADAVGVSREAFRVLQQSEGVFDQRTQKWSDALDKAGKVIPDGGKGAVQLVQSTFEDVKKRNPGLVEGDIHDVKSNLMAGAIYFKEIAQQVGGDFRSAIQGYKQGPGTVIGSQEQRDRATASIPADRREQNRRSIDQYGSLYTNSVITRPGAPQAIGAVQASEVTSAPPAAGPATNAQQIATAKFKKDQEDALDNQRKSFANEQELYDIFQRDLDKAREKVNQEAQRQAAEGHTEALDQATIDQQVTAQQDIVSKQYHEAWLQRLHEREQFATTVRERELVADKTNLTAQLELVNRRFDAERTQADQLYAKGNYGVPVDTVHNDIEKARQDALSRTTVDVAKATVDAVVQQRDKELQEVQSRLKTATPGEAARLYAEQARVVADFTPKITDALRRSNAALDKVPNPDTEAVRAQRAQNVLTARQAQRPEIIQQGEQQATSATTADLQATLKQRSVDLTQITDQVKVGGQSFTTALTQIVELSQRTAPQIRQLVDTTNDGLRQIASNPLTSPQERAALQTEIQKNLLAPAQAVLDTQNAVMAALQEDKAKLDKLLEEYKQAVLDLDKKIRDSRLSPTQAATERARLDANFIPRIAEAGRTFQSDVSQARGAAVPLGLSPGFQQQLGALGQKAATESNPQTLQSQSVEDQGKLLLDQGRRASQTISEVQRTQSELIKLGATTQTAAEGEIKQAFAAAKVEVDALAPAINDSVKQMEALGNTQGARKLADDFKLLQAQVTYVDPLIQQITQTLEGSFVSRGAQAFDTVAKAIAGLAQKGGQLKNVWAAVGQAFGDMVAGILQDIAKVILKYELLKLVRDALGVDPGSGLGQALGGGGGATGGGGGTGGVGGIAGIFASLLGGGGAATTGAFDAAGVELGGAAAGSSIAAAGAASAGASAFDTANLLPLVAGLFHEGGEVTSAKQDRSRVVDLSLFREARRMHTGGMVGLSPDEVPTILQKGEQVLSKAQVAMKNQAAVSGASSGGTAIRNVLAVGDKEIASAMNSSHGEQVVLNVLRRNAPTIKQYLG